MKKVNRFLGAVFSVLALSTAAFADESERKVDVWDFGGSVDETEEVTNNITADIFDNLPDSVLAKDGKFKKGDIECRSERQNLLWF